MESNRKRIARAAIGLAVFSGIGLGVTAADKTPEVPYPGGYQTWRHVKSEVVEPEARSGAAEGGKFFHFYANEQAVEGYRAGKFPNGSVVVRETLRVVAGEGERKGQLTEGERSGLDVMIKDDRLYTETGGWGFDTFDSKNAGSAEKDGAQCYACHVKQKDHDLVFTTLTPLADEGTPYPEGYRHWHFLHSSMVSKAFFDASAKKPCEKPCTAGLFQFYANDKAMAGLRTGTYQDGAILAEEMLEWLSTSTGGGKEGTRRLVGVMVRDSQRYSATGGWGYGTFDDDSKVDRLDAKERETCYQCHIPRKDQGFVFTKYTER
jgi:hypothetical protein